MPGNFVGGDAITFEAGADLRTSQYGVVYKGTNTTVNLLTVGTSVEAMPEGVLINKPNTGRNASVRQFNGRGKISVNAGAAITVGQRLTVSTSGMVIAVSALGEWHIGYALTAAGAAGERIDMRPITPTQVNSA